MVMLPHSVIGPHYTVDSSDVMYPLRRNYWRCALAILANVAREEMPVLVPLPNPAIGTLVSRATTSIFDYEECYLRWIF